MAESAPSILRQMQRRMEEEKLKELPLRNIVGQGSRRGMNSKIFCFNSLAPGDVAIILYM